MSISAFASISRRARVKRCGATFGFATFFGARAPLPFAAGFFVGAFFFSCTRFVGFVRVAPFLWALVFGFFAAFVFARVVAFLATFFVDLVVLFFARVATIYVDHYTLKERIVKAHMERKSQKVGGETT
jgi:hypothetical protein